MNSKHQISFSNLINDPEIRQLLLVNVPKIFLTITLTKRELIEYFRSNTLNFISKCKYNTGDAQFFQMFLGHTQTFNKNTITEKEFRGLINPPILLVFEITNETVKNIKHQLCIYPYEIAIEAELSENEPKPFPHNDYKVTIGNGNKVEYIKSTIGLFYSNFTNYRQQTLNFNHIDKAEIISDFKLKNQLSSLETILNQNDKKKYCKCELRYITKSMTLKPCKLLAPINTLTPLEEKELVAKEITFVPYPPSSDNEELLKNLEQRFVEQLNE